MKKVKLHQCINNKQKMKNNPKFSKLLDRYQQGKLVGDEKQLMDEWFEDLAKDNIHPLWSADDKQALKNRVFGEVVMKQMNQQHTASAPTRRAWRVAAAVMLLAVVSFLVWKSDTAPAMTFVAQNISVTSVDGTVNKVMLADGSIVWLKDNSALTYPATFEGATRNVILQGEALFEVAKDAKHPFIIQCGDLTTTVLGTSFNIRSRGNDVEVVVLTGKVSLTSATVNTGQEVFNGVQIVPNEKAIYHKTEKQLAKMESAKEEAIAAVAGTEYDMHFVDTRMDEIVRRIEGKFGMHVSLENPKLANCVVTANFTDQSLVKTLDILASVLSIKYEVKENTIRVKGNGCN
jgi:transmembrane sensor